MARATLLEVAKKIAESMKSRAIQPETQYTLHAFAKLAGCSQSAVLKVLEMWQIFDQVSCRITIDRLATSKGKRPNYGIRVEGKPQKNL